MIDTAEMYGEGSAEEIVGEAIRGRAKPYIVSKVYPHNATRAAPSRPANAASSASASSASISTCCTGAAGRGWRRRSRRSIACARRGRSRLRRQHFDRGDMEDAARLDEGLTGSNQVLYCLSRRGPEFDLLPLMRKRSIPLMAYSPLDQGGLPRKPALKKLADEVGCTPAQPRTGLGSGQPGVVTIPKSSSRERVKENFGALEVKLSPKILADLDRAFPPPKGKQALEML